MTERNFRKEIEENRRVYTNDPDSIEDGEIDMEQWESDVCDEIDNLKKEIESWKEITQGNEPYIKSLNEQIIKLRNEMVEELNLTKSEQSTLIYLESCCVDYGGKVMSIRMNKEDNKNIEKFREIIGLIDVWERLPMSSVESFVSTQRHTHYVELTEKGWNASHHYRKVRYERTKERSQKYRRG